MAEIFATASAAIGVAAAAGQLIDGVAKLSAFCSEIRDIPDDIQSEVEHLSMLVDVLDCVQTELSHPSLDQAPTRRIAMKVWSNLQQSSDHVRKVLQEMQIKLGNKSKWGRVRAAGMKKKLEKAALRVQNAESLLVLAFASDNRALLREGLAISRQGFTAGSTQTGVIASKQQTSKQVAGECLEATKPEQSDNPRKDERPQTRAICQGAPRRPGMAPGGSRFRRWRLSIWLLNQAWEWRWYQASRGWEFCLRSYQILGLDSTLISAIREGNITHVRLALSQGEATIWDQDEQGSILLHYAAKYCAQSEGSLAVLQLFLHSGADINALNNEGWPAHSWLGISAKEVRTRDHDMEQRLMKAYRLFFNHPKWIMPRPTFEMGSMSPRPQSDLLRLSLNPPAEALRLVLAETWPPWNKTTISDRIDILVPDDAPWEIGAYPSTIRVWLGEDELISSFASCRPGSQCRFIIYAFCTLAFWLARDSCEEIEEARRMLICLVRAGASLELGVGEKQHLLSAFLIAFEWSCWRNFLDLHASAAQWYSSLTRWHKRAHGLIQEGFRRYAAEICLLGLDIVLFIEAGRGVSLLFDREEVALPFSVRVIGATCVGNVQDWRLWLSNPRDEWAGEFWDMLDHPERRVPGAWIDD